MTRGYSSATRDGYEILNLLDDTQREQLKRSCEHGAECARKAVAARVDASDHFGSSVRAALVAIDGVDALVREVAKSLPVSPCCRPGCSSCCWMRVECSTPEAAAVALFVAMMPADQRDAVVADVRRVAAQSRALGRRKRLRTVVWCPFLDQSMGRCMIYPTRPLACRTYQSCDVAACDELQRHPNRNVRVPNYPQLSLVGAAVCIGALEALRASGISSSEGEFIHLVDRAIPAAIEWHRRYGDGKHHLVGAVQ